MKKILISLAIIAGIAAVVTGFTIAYFNDTETSTGNIFVAGAIDLKVDHVKQTYNDIDCKTCSVVLISDESNMVVEKNGSPIASYPAVYVGSEDPYFIHSAWTAQDDPTLAAAGAEWIWESDPTRQEDTEVDVTYTFRKTFEWWGPITGSDLWFAIGSDNSVKAYLNGVLVGENDGEYGYQKENMLHIPGTAITANVQQGANVLEFEVKNWGQGSGATPYSNPAGLVYKFEIDGLCGDDFFKTHCTLFDEKNLVPGEDYFWQFDDVKPGDQGVNVISLHVYDNDAYVCLINAEVEDDENVRTETEIDAGDTSDDEGELSNYLQLFIWNDKNGDGQYSPATEDNLYEGDFLPTEMLQLSLTATTTDYLGVAWCMGEQTVSHCSGTISCSGVGNQDQAQTDQLTASLILYAEQQRNNGEFSCALVPPANVIIQP